MFGSNTFGEAYFGDDPAWIDNPITGTAAVTAPHATLAATGTEKFSATGAIAAPHATLSGTGTQSLSSTGSVTSPVETLSGTGNVANATAQGTGGGGPGPSRRTRRQQFSEAPWRDTGPVSPLPWLQPVFGGRAWVDAPAASIQARATLSLGGSGSVKVRPQELEVDVATGPREVNGQAAIKGGTLPTAHGRVRQSRQKELDEDALLGITAA